ncbi:MAG: hypothetical protein ACE5KU_00685 [Nitrososphaerales archaeon]
MKSSVRRVLALAKWEVLRGAGRGNRSSTIGISVMIVLLLGFLALFIVQGFSVSFTLYSVAASTHGFDEVFEVDSRFYVQHLDEQSALQKLNSGDIDIVVTEQKIYFNDKSSRSLAALSALEEVSRSYRERFFYSIVKQNLDETFRFLPIWVKVDYKQVSEGPLLIQPQLSPEGDIEPGFEYERLQNGEQQALIDPRVERSRARIPFEGLEVEPDADRLSTLDDAGDEALPPSELAPQLGFPSVVQGVLLLAPAIFLSQAYGNSLMGERVGRKAELIFASPLSRYEIILGKTLPYLLLALLATVTISFVQGLFRIVDLASFESIGLISMTIFPAALMYFALSLVAVLMASSFREMTVIAVFFQTILTVYLIAPAALPVIFPMSLISPLTATTQVFAGNLLTTSQYLLSTVPFTLSALTIYVLASSLFSEEALFVHRRILGRTLEGIDTLTTSPNTAFLLSAASVVFAITAQLAILSFIIILQPPGAIFLLVISFAAVEEILKSAAPYVMISRGKVKRSYREGFKLALYSGFGFFLAEKTLLLIMVSSLIPYISPSAIPGILGLLILPLIVHVSGAMISSTGLIKTGGARYPVIIALATIFHASYNLVLISSLIPVV